MAKNPIKPYLRILLLSSEQVTGFCALCLRECLASLEPSGESSSFTSTSAFVPSFNNIGGAGSNLQPELRHRKSVSVGKYEALKFKLRQNSCDTRSKNTLSHLFNIDDKSKELNRNIKVETKSLGFSKITELSKNENGEEVRVYILVTNVHVEKDLKTMKEQHRYRMAEQQAE